MSGPPLRPQGLGRLGDPWALQLQRARRKAIIEDRAPEALWLLEHPPVVTLGRRGGELRGLPAGIPVVSVERGGLATVHLPGQLVGYLLVDVGTRGIAVRHAVWCIEEGLIDWLAGEGIAAGRREGAPGVWVRDRKIGAVGLHFRRGVSMHGFSLNLGCDLTAFDWIVPCGLVGTGVTSVQDQSGAAPSPAAAANRVGAAVLARLIDTPSGLG